MGGGITGFIQANDTDLHRRLKALYRNEEMELMLKMLEVDKNKVPAPTREDMVNMLMSSWKKVETDFAAVFKKLFVTNALDGTEDHLVSDKLFALIGSTMKNIRREILESALPATLQALIKQIIPPKGIRRKAIEGAELLDYVDDDPYLFDDDDDGIDCDESGSDDENDDAEEAQDESAVIAATAEPSRDLIYVQIVPSIRTQNF